MYNCNLNLVKLRIDAIVLNFRNMHQSMLGRCPGRCIGSLGFKSPPRRLKCIRMSLRPIRAASTEESTEGKPASGRVTGGDGGKAFNRPDDAKPLRVGLQNINLISTSPVGHADEA